MEDLSSAGVQVGKKRSVLPQLHAVIFSNQLKMWKNVFEIALTFWTPNDAAELIFHLKTF